MKNVTHYIEKKDETRWSRVKRQTKAVAFYIGLVGVGASGMSYQTYEFPYSLKTNAVAYERSQVTQLNDEDVSLFDALMAEHILDYYNQNEEVALAEAKVKLYNEAKAHAITSVWDDTLAVACWDNPHLDGCNELMDRLEARQN
jgi:hypothetical protein